MDFENNIKIKHVNYKMKFVIVSLIKMFVLFELWFTFLFILIEIFNFKRLN